MPKFQNREKAIKDGKFINTHHTQISKQRKSHETWKIYKHPSYPNFKTEKKKKKQWKMENLYTPIIPKFQNREKRMVFVAYPSENERWDSRVS